MNKEEARESIKDQIAKLTKLLITLNAVTADGEAIEKGKTYYEATEDCDSSLLEKIIITSEATFEDSYVKDKKKVYIYRYLYSDPKLAVEKMIEESQERLNEATDEASYYFKSLLNWKKIFQQLDNKGEV